MSNARLLRHQQETPTISMSRTMLRPVGRHPGRRPPPPLPSVDNCSHTHTRAPLQASRRRLDSRRRVSFAEAGFNFDFSPIHFELPDVVVLRILYFLPYRVRSSCSRLRTSIFFAECLPNGASVQALAASGETGQQHRIYPIASHLVRKRAAKGEREVRRSVIVSGLTPPFVQRVATAAASSDGGANAVGQCLRYSRRSAHKARPLDYTSNAYMACSQGLSSIVPVHIQAYDSTLTTC